jgi:hypothetical protein
VRLRAQQSVGCNQRVAGLLDPGRVRPRREHVLERLRTDVCRDRASSMTRLSPSPAAWVSAECRSWCSVHAVVAVNTAAARR